MTIYIEAEHCVVPATPATFARYLDLYTANAVPAMQRAGFELLGAWRQVSGPLGRDLLLVRFDSPEAQLAASARLAGDAELQAGLEELRSGGFALSEITKQAVPLVGTGEVRAEATAGDAGSGAYRLIRRTIGLTHDQVALDALNAVAGSIEASAGWQLLTAYKTLVGDRGELSELWAATACASDWYPPSAPADALLALDEISTSSTLTILEPLGYSPLQ